MSVDLCRLAVGMTQELLDRPHRLTGRSQPRGKGVTQIVKAHLMDFRLYTGLLEALGDLGTVDRIPGMWMSEDEIIIPAKLGALGIAIKNRARQELPTTFVARRRQSARKRAGAWANPWLPMGRPFQTHPGSQSAHSE